MFDKDKTGYVNVEELQTIIQSLGRDPSEAQELLAEQQLENQPKLTFDEFLKTMKLLEFRIVQAQQQQEAFQDQQEIDPIEGTLEERNKFGVLLPRTGVHFLPDSKVIDFLK